MSCRLTATMLVAILTTACSDRSDDSASPPARIDVAGQDSTLSVPPQPTSESRTLSSVLDALGPAYASANIDNGRRLWSRCSSCHSLDGSRPPLPGPDLQNILGARAGTQPGFDYSTALQEADFVWTAERLNAWVASPDDFLEGAAMSFSGVSEPEDRRDLIACIAAGETCLDGDR